MTAGLAASTGRLIRNGAAALELGDTWAEDTARVVLAQPEIRDGLAAAGLVQQLRARHVEVPWGASTDSTVCGCGRSWPCEDARMLGGAA